jgi:hypothetical protein
LACFKRGNFDVGVFPDGEKALIGTRSFRRIARQCMSAAKLHMCERTQRQVLHDAMIEHLLKLAGCRGARKIRIVVAAVTNTPAILR